MIELGLLREDSDSQYYDLVRSNHPALPLPIFGYALATYLERRRARAQSVSLHELAFGDGAPGRVFGLNESGLLTRLEALGSLTSDALVYDETAGLKQIFLHKALEPRALLERYYDAFRRRTAWDGTGCTTKL